MLLNELNFLDRINLKLVSRIFPVKKAAILLLDKIEVDLKEAKINQINVPSISLPQISSDFCLARNELCELKVVLSYIQIVTCRAPRCQQKIRIQIDENSIGKELKIVCPTCKHGFLYSPVKNELIEDFTIWLRRQLDYPEIESFNILLNQPRKAGKSYNKFGSEDKQPTLFDYEKEKECIHGLKKEFLFHLCGKGTAGARKNRFSC